MRFAGVVAVAAVVGGVIAAVACGSGSGSGGLAPGECDPNNDPVYFACSLPCTYDVYPDCVDGVWTCPAQPTGPWLGEYSECSGSGPPPQCSSGSAECQCYGDTFTYVWVCPNDGGIIEGGPSEGGGDAAADVANASDAPTDAPSDVASDAADE